MIRKYFISTVVILIAVASKDSQLLPVRTVGDYGNFESIAPQNSLLLVMDKV